MTAGHAVTAMVLNGLGFLNQQLSLVPRFASISRSLASLPQAFKPAISTMTRSGVLSIRSTTLG